MDKTEQIGVGILAGLIGLTILGSLIWVLDTGTTDSEISECKQWKEYASEYVNFYLVKWQNDECRSHGIIINAPVK